MFLKHYQGLAVAWTGIAANLLIETNDQHVMFRKIQRMQIILKVCIVLIWDGISMTNKYAFDTVDRLFKDLCRNSKPFDGKEIIVSGDFRQTLPILCHGGII